jgi:hypothetical protein
MKYKDYKYDKLYDYDNDIIDEAINNTYKILFEDWTIDELLEIGAKHFLINPALTEIPKDILETMMLYYEEEERYERCQKIKEVLDKFNKK